MYEPPAHRRPDPGGPGPGTAGRPRYGRGLRPATPRRPPGGLRVERRAPARVRRRLLTEARALHATTSERLATIDAQLEALVDQRLACLDALVECRDQLRPRWSTRHASRGGPDEEPFPEPPPTARALEGAELRTVSLTILRRHGAQRLRDLHGLIHLYGYWIDSVRPVQRLADAMAHELRCGRVERLERGVYGPVESGIGPSRYAPPPTELGAPLPWDRPVTDPGPPLVDPDVANDPELWSGAAWPTEHDLPEDPATEQTGRTPRPHTHEGPEPTDQQLDDAPTPAPAPPDSDSDALRGDSPANRPSAVDEQVWRWEPPP